MQKFKLIPGNLSLDDIAKLYHYPMQLEVDLSFQPIVDAAQSVVQEHISKNIISYGINTGFGKLAQTVIPNEQLKQLQINLVLSHACGTGSHLAEKLVKMIILLKINALAQGFSGVRWALIQHLVALYNSSIIPCIPAKGSVGASGDLAPLAHLACALIGTGEVYYQGTQIPAAAALQKIGLEPISLEPKEGLALLNGTQVSTALAIEALFKSQMLFDASLYAGAMSLDATQSNLLALDPQIQLIRRLPEQLDVAKTLQQLLEKSEIQHSPSKLRVQDPYSLRCQPQVMGACLVQMRHVARLLQNEINAVTDNPLVFVKTQQILAGGNFHAQVVSFAADTMAIAIATIGNISERRIAILMDPAFTGLPAFLVKQSGINSGFMLTQVTAASLASENKVYAHPASVDTIPTSSDQEDHVSMATFAARRLHEMIDNATTIVAIELLAACQGIDLRTPHKTSPILQEIFQIIRKEVPFYESDRYLSADIEKVVGLIGDRKFMLSELKTVYLCRMW